ncbi:PhzF family phenazine biosynthesis protein [Streptomyces purpureus]|uniref:Phenazine antibiotic biosynthesis-like protein n=1 Tax=Streptomyces purpureus TaxID=1951 RepID=A0A918LN73_9ACTN|nr:PhzF family phenazine biosynthesis protein [Streptomyces purpureus]GGT29146.1 phenazine antibiotic biosynthesis-like protein [Streptomyces purpureus]
MIDYEIVDMFTDTPFAGCALGVVPDASGLGYGDMRAVAGEIALTETAFVLPPLSPEATYRVRVFTPDGESPYGGHSSVGTAATLVRTGRVPAGAVVQECGGKLLSLDASPEGAVLTVRGEPPAPRTWDHAAPLAACGLTDDDLVGRPRVAGFGPAFHILPVRAEAVARAVRDASAPVWDTCPDAVVVAYDRATRCARVRVFAPGYGMPEDPACASAALGLGPWLAHAGLLPGADGTFDYRVLQGAEMGRPATLRCTVTVRGARAVAAGVFGQVAAVAQGRMRVPSDVTAARV